MQEKLSEKQLAETLLSNKQLQLLVEKISLEFFNKFFLHCAYYNNRLKTSGGRYHLVSHDIDINPKVTERYGIEELIKVIKHELCHYHLHLEGKGYQHRDQDFKTLLKQTGGTRYVQPLTDKKKQTFRQYQCENCKTVITRRRRVDTNKYVCGKCHGKLTEKGLTFS